MKTAILIALFLTLGICAYEPEFADDAAMVTVTVQAAPVQPADPVSILTVIPYAGGTVTVNGVVITTPTKYDLNALPLVDGYRVHIKSVPDVGNRTWISLGPSVNTTDNQAADEKYVVDLDQGDDTDAAVVRFAAADSGGGGGNGCSLGTGNVSILLLLAFAVLATIKRYAWTLKRQ